VLYLDSSALIKNYINEDGTLELQARLTRETAAGSEFFTSVLTYAEIHAIIARKFREGNLSKSNAARVHDQFEENWLSGFTQVEVSSAVLSFVRGIVNASSLRGADTLHLASALLVREMVRLRGKSRTLADELIFLSSDKQLLAAAEKQGIVTFDPTNM
jgi:predicted nucleic acid-binding protein